MNFGVSGLLWNRSLVMYDVETGSLWSHILGEAKQGPLAGTKLEPLSTELVTWEAWRRANPGTTVLNMSRTRFFDRGMDHNKAFYDDLGKWVYGWTVGLQRYHLPVARLQTEPVINITVPNARLVATFDAESTDVNLFEREVGGRDLTFAAAGPGRIVDEQTRTVWNARTGEGLEGSLRGQRLKIYLGMMSYANAWESFFATSKRVPLQ